MQCKLSSYSLLWVGSPDECCSAIKSKRRTSRDVHQNLRCTFRGKSCLARRAHTGAEKLPGSHAHPHLLCHYHLLCHCSYQDEACMTAAPSILSSLLWVPLQLFQAFCCVSILLYSCCVIRIWRTAPAPISAAPPRLQALPVHKESIMHQDISKMEQPASVPEAL